MNKSTIQYTVRNVPPATDRRLRKLAKISGKSLNEVIIDEISEKDNINKPGSNLVDSLDWFIGGNTIGDDVLRALEEDDKAQKELTRKQWLEDDN
jgi:hypothetical protein